LKTIILLLLQLLLSGHDETLVPYNVIINATLDHQFWNWKLLALVFL